MKNLIQNLIDCKSRFYFNLSFKNIIFYSFQYLLYKKINYRLKVTEKIKDFYPDSNIELFHHGRSALFKILTSFKKDKKRKKILVNSLTLFEIINVIVYSGYEPIFIDCKNKNSLETDAVELIEKHKNQLKAIIVTHLNGANKDIINIKEKINELNLSSDNENKIYIIEDCAVSFGAKFDNKFVGSFGDYSILSFNIMKNITSITGGALIDNVKESKIDKSNIEFIEPKIINLIKKISFVTLLHFLNSRVIFPFFFIFIKYAYKNKINFFLKKYRTDFELKIFKTIPKDFVKLMSNYQAFLLLNQFKNISQNTEKRINNSKYLYEKIKLNDYVKFPQIEFDKKNIFIDFPIICNNAHIKEKIWKLSLDKMIDIKNYYYTNCGYNIIYSEYLDKKLENSKHVSENIFMLPVNVFQKKKDLDRLVKLFNNNEER